MIDNRRASGPVVRWPRGPRLEISRYREAWEPQPKGLSLSAEGSAARSKLMASEGAIPQGKPVLSRRSPSLPEGMAIATSLASSSLPLPYTWLRGPEDIQGSPLQPHWEAGPQGPLALDDCK